MSKRLREERNREIKYECPSCGEPEPSTHATRCEDPDRTALYRDSVSKVEHWMQKSTTEPGLRCMLVSYLKEHGKVQMSDLLPSAVQGVSHQTMKRYAKIAEKQDRLGWDCLTEGRILSILVQHQHEGRISSILVQHQHEHTRNTQNQMTTKRWVEGMIQQLTGVVHRQWVYRNTLVHFRRQDGVSQNQFDTLVRRVEELVVMTQMRCWKVTEIYSKSVRIP